MGLILRTPPGEFRLVHPGEVSTSPGGSGAPPPAAPSAAPVLNSWSKFPGLGDALEGIEAGAATPPATKAKVDAWALRRLARRLHPWDEERQAPSRVYQCGRTVIGTGEDYAFLGRSGESGSDWYGVQTCGRVWECATCARKAAAHHRDEITHAIERWTASGGTVHFVTFTIRHTEHDSLESMRRGLAKAWQEFQRGREWVNFQREAGAKVLRSLEVVWGERHGWHPHLHVLLFVREKVNVRSTHGWMIGRWRKMVGKVLDERHVGSWRHAVHWHPEPCSDPSRAADYVTKFGLEMTSVLTKTERKVTDGAGHYFTRNQWGILRDLGYLLADQDNGHIEEGSRDWLELHQLAGLWGSFWRGMKRARWVAWGKGLRPAVGLGPELEDEEAAATDTEETAPEVIVRLPPEIRKPVLMGMLRRELRDLCDRNPAATVGELRAACMELSRVRLGAVEFGYLEAGNSPEYLERFTGVVRERYARYRRKRRDT